MSKIALISDIHANLEALDRVLKDIKDRKIKKVICLGDLVGYGANPNECVERVSEVADIVIAGNHDWAVLGKTDYSNFNPVARAAVEWTKKNTKPQNIEFLNRLGLTASLKGPSLFFVHSTPRMPKEWNYLFDLIEFEYQFNYFTERGCFIGHSHEPACVRLENGTVEALSLNPLKMEKDSRYIINVGSVGQPRDLDPRAAYAVVDAKAQAVELIRLAYDIAATQKK